MIFSIYLHKCMKNANNATNKQTNKQTDRQTKRQQTVCCTEYLRFEYRQLYEKCVYNARRHVHGILNSKNKYKVRDVEGKGMGLSVGAEHTLKINRSSSSPCALLPLTSLLALLLVLLSAICGHVFGSEYSSLCSLNRF